MPRQDVKGHICIEGKLYCAADKCGKSISDIANSVLIFSYTNILPFCSSECMEKTLRKYISSKDEKFRVNKAMKGRNLLKELKFNEVGD